MPSNALIDFDVHLGAEPKHDATHRVKMEVKHLNFWYGVKQALQNVSLRFHKNEVAAPKLRCCAASIEPSQTVLGRIRALGSGLITADRR